MKKAREKTLLLWEGRRREELLKDKKLKWKHGGLGAYEKIVTGEIK